MKLRLLAIAFICPAGMGAQLPPDIASIASQRPVAAAMRMLENDFPRHVTEWLTLTEIPAPSTHEQQRAAYIRRALSAEGLSATTDSIGNVTVTYAGMSDGPFVVIAGHMDTVHPLGTDVRVNRVGDTLKAPGVFDDAASVANMLAVIRAMRSVAFRTRGTLEFVFTTQEELGLRGFTYWLDHAPRPPDLVIAVDGPLGVLSYGALGVRWTKYSFEAPGAHTMYSAGKPHPARAVAKAITDIYEVALPHDRGDAVMNVGMLGGGTVFNAVPARAWFTVDLRVADPGLLDSLDTDITGRVARAAAAYRVSWSAESTLRIPAGGSPGVLADRAHHPLVETAIAVHRFLGVQLPNGATPDGTTDANAAVVRNIPAVAIGRSFGGNQHTLEEWADVPSALTGAKLLLLLVVSLAGLPGS